MEQLPEIIDAGANDEQTAQGVGHSMESGALDQEDIDHGDDGICQENDIECSPGASAVDDLAKHIEVKGKLQGGGEIAEQAIIDHGHGQVIFHPGKDATEQQEEGEIPEPLLVCAEKKDRQAC